MYGEWQTVGSEVTAECPFKLVESYRFAQKVPLRTWRAECHHRPDPAAGLFVVSLQDSVWQGLLRSEAMAWDTARSIDGCWNILEDFRLIWTREDGAFIHD